MESNGAKSNTMKTPWHQIPGWFDFHDLCREVVERAPETGAHFVEVGVFLGRSTSFLLDTIELSGKKIALDSIDSFGWGNPTVLTMMDKCLADGFSLFAPPAWLRTELAKGTPQLEIVRRLVDRVAFNPVVASGQEHAKTYADASLDYVWIDTAHTYEDTETMLRAYIPKMKPSGVIAGHDHTPNFPGVVCAVKDVLGNKARQLGCSFWCECAGIAPMASIGT
jgi:hypothetical protein